MKGKAAEAGTAPTATGAAFVCADADIHTYAPTAPMHLLPYALCPMPYALCPMPYAPTLTSSRS